MVIWLINLTMTTHRVNKTDAWSSIANEIKVAPRALTGQIARNWCVLSNLKTSAIWIETSLYNRVVIRKTSLYLWVSFESRPERCHNYYLCDRAKPPANFSALRMLSYWGGRAQTQDRNFIGQRVSAAHIPFEIAHPKEERLCGGRKHKNTAVFTENLPTIRINYCYCRKTRLVVLPTFHTDNAKHVWWKERRGYQLDTINTHFAVAPDPTNTWILDKSRR